MLRQSLAALKIILLRPYVWLMLLAGSSFLMMMLLMTWATFAQSIEGPSEVVFTFQHGQLILAISALVGVFMLPQIFSLQTGMAFSMPFSGVVPGFRRAHLPWPVVVAIATVALWLCLASRFGFAIVPALALGIVILGAIGVNLIIAGDIDRFASKLASYGPVAEISVFAILYGSVIIAKEPFRRFAGGEYPLLSVILIVVGLSYATWKFIRLARLRRIMAENGIAYVPGLQMNFGGDSSPVTPQPLQSTYQRIIRNSVDSMIDRRLAKSANTPWYRRFLAIKPSGTIIDRPVPLLVLLCASIYWFLVSPEIDDNFKNIGVFFVMVSNILVFTWLVSVLHMWTSRRRTLVVEFLSPIDRQRFWRELKLAVLSDLVAPFFVALCLVVSALWMLSESPSLMPIAALSLFTCSGTFAFVHAFLIWIAHAKHQKVVAAIGWTIQATFFFASIAAFGFYLEGEGYEIFSILLTIGVFVLGLLSQVLLHIFVEDREIGL